MKTPSSSGPLRHLGPALLELERAGLLRTPSPPSLGELVLCSNDYLGYAAEPWAGREAPGGAGASRLVTGEHACHEAAERALASWVGADEALLFTSGYAANLGALSALAAPGDVIVSDALNHASLVDGCRLSGAAVLVVAHRDGSAFAQALASARSARRRWVVTESCFSMEGDRADLVRLRALCDAHDAALVVDEAHALGVAGPSGSGLCREAGIAADVLVGTLGKAVGLQGAFVAGSVELRAWLWNRARPFVFSTGIAPALAQAIVERVARVAADDAGRSRLAALTARLRARLHQAGLPVDEAGGPILPWIVGAPEQAVRLSRALRERGIVVQAIRPPTVPAGTSRLRISVHARLSEADLDRAASALAELHAGAAGAAPVVSRATTTRGRGPARVVVVAGTGTGVGKTHAAAALVGAALSRGRRACGLKPIESGVVAGGPTDAAALAAVSGCPVAPAPYRFPDPVSPHLAARRAGAAIDLGAVAAWVALHDAELGVVESAGGLFSPLGPGVSNLDLVRALCPDAVLLVAPDRLGVLHEVGACLVAMRALAPELPRPVVVLQPVASPDGSSTTNAAELCALGIAREVVTLPRGAPAAEATQAAAETLLDRLYASFT